MPSTPLHPLIPALAVLLAAGTAGAAEGTPEASADPGWSPIILGAPENMKADEFADAVVADLPPELFDRGANFTSHEAFRADADYKLVMVFHGEGENPDAGTLCTVAAGRAPEAEAAPDKAPQLDNLMESTGVTAAFCEDGRVLSTATDKISGQAVPGQMSFGFLVSDVAKQLFPDGFEVIPSGPVRPTVQP